MPSAIDETIERVERYLKHRAEITNFDPDLIASIWVQGTNHELRVSDLETLLTVAARPSDQKRYLIFIGEEYYPRGGWSDLSDSFDSVDDAKSHIEVHPTYYSPDWAQLVDLQTGDVVDYLYKGDGTTWCQGPR